MCMAGCTLKIIISVTQALASTDIISTKTLDNEVISGDNIGQIVGVKIATPFFGTGFNFCIGALGVSVMTLVCLQSILRLPEQLRLHGHDRLLTSRWPDMQHARAQTATLAASPRWASWFQTRRPGCCQSSMTWPTR